MVGPEPLGFDGVAQKAGHVVRLVRAHRLLGCGAGGEHGVGVGLGQGAGGGGGEERQGECGDVWGHLRTTLGGGRGFH